MERTKVKKSQNKRSEAKIKNRNYEKELYENKENVDPLSNRVSISTEIDISPQVEINNLNSYNNFNSLSSLSNLHQSSAFEGNNYLLKIKITLTQISSRKKPTDKLILLNLIQPISLPFHEGPSLRNANNKNFPSKQIPPRSSSIKRERISPRKKRKLSLA